MRIFSLEYAERTLLAFRGYPLRYWDEGGMSLGVLSSYH